MSSLSRNNKNKARSYSGLQTYLTCPKQYHFQYIEQIKRPLHKALSFGITLHNVLHHYLLEEQQSQQTNLFDVEHEQHDKQRLDMLLEKHWISQGYADSEQEQFRYNEAKEQLKAWQEWQQRRTSKIIGLEESFQITIADVKYRGRIDRIDQVSTNELLIIDYKSGHVGTTHDVQKSLQLTLYAMVASEKYPHYDVSVGHLYLTNCSLITAKRDQHDFKAFSNIVEHVEERMFKQDFEATPSEQSCSHCAYRNICNQATNAS